MRGKIVCDKCAGRGVVRHWHGSDDAETITCSKCNGDGVFDECAHGLIALDCDKCKIEELKAKIAKLREDLADEGVLRAAAETQVVMLKRELKEKEKEASRYSF